MPHAVRRDLKPLVRAITGVHEGVHWREIRGKRIWVKDFNAQPHTRYHATYFSTNTAEEALAHAAFYDELRKRGFYHPATRFYVDRSADGKPGVVAVMPHLKTPDALAPETVERLCKLPGEVLGEPIRRHHDLEADRHDNYGTAHENGQCKLYFHDLHIFYPYDNPRALILEWYRKRLGERKMARGEAGRP